jgi:hypothetical protein
MMGQQLRDRGAPLPLSQGPPSNRESNARSIELPSWESFAVQDRHLLIGLIVQTARRQVQSGLRQRIDDAGR